MSLILTLALMGAPAQAPRDPNAKPCENGQILAAQQGRESHNVHPLGAEPPARHILGVVRTIDGCNMPIAASEPIGQPRRDARK